MDKSVRDEETVCKYSKLDNQMFKRLFKDIVGFEGTNENEIIKALAEVNDIEIKFNYDSLYENGADLPDVLIFGADEHGLEIQGMWPVSEVNKKEGNKLTDKQKWIVNHIVSVMMVDLIECLLRSQRIVRADPDTDWKDDYIPTNEEVA